MNEEKRFCDGDCNHCPIISHPNSRLLTKILNEAYDQFGDEFYAIVQKNCPNLTCCYECGVDDFTHIEGCQIIEHIDHEMLWAKLDKILKHLGIEP